MQQGRTGDWGFSALVSLVALLPRLFVALTWAEEPVWDGHYYHYGAERIAQGLGYSEDVLMNGVLTWKPWAHYPVGYSAFLAGFYALMGAKAWVAPVVNAVLGSLTALTLHRVARHYLDTTRSQIAAALVALHPGLIAYTAVVMTETLSAWLTLLAIAVAVRYRIGWRSLVLPGIVIGLSALVRPACILMAPLLMLVGHGSWPRRALYGVLISGVAVFTVLPWTLRNCQRMDGCALISTNGGWNLAIGALTETGRFETLRAKDGCPVVTGQVQQDRCWANVGKQVIEENPRRWLALIPKKLAQTFDHESFAVEYLHEADPRAWPDHRRRAARLLFSNFHRGLLVFAALGAVALVPWRRELRLGAFAQGAALLTILGVGLYATLVPENPFFLVVVALLGLAIFPLPGKPEQGPIGRLAVGAILTTAVVHAVFFGDDRYHIVIVPELCLLAAAALRPWHGALARAVAPLEVPASGWTRREITTTLPDAMPTFRIRRIEATDDAAMAAIIRQVMPEFGAGGAGFAVHDPEVDFLSKAYSGARSAYFVVVDKSNKVLGGGGVAPLDGGPPEVCELKKMYFLPELRGHGMGRALLRRCIASAREFGYRITYVETLTGMEAAQHLYRGMGFQALSAPLGQTGHHGCDRYYELDLSMASN